jgi:hypothetical protein
MSQPDLFLNFSIETFLNFLVHPCATPENAEALNPKYHRALYEELIFPSLIGSKRKTSIPPFSCSSPDFASGHI